jgi:hypothetical protein
MRMHLAAVVTGMGLLAGCGEMVDKDLAVQTMEKAGFKDVRVTAQHGINPTFYGCGKDDAVAFNVSAQNPTGKQVTATVCCGLVFKNCTIRY